jgi:hypothetical protein
MSGNPCGRDAEWALEALRSAPRANARDRNQTTALDLYGAIGKIDEELNGVYRESGQEREVVIRRDPHALSDELSRVRSQLRTRVQTAVTPLQERIALTHQQLDQLRTSIMTPTGTWKTRQQTLENSKRELDRLDQVRRDLLRQKEGSRFAHNRDVNVEAIEPHVREVQDCLRLFGQESAE